VTPIADRHEGSEAVAVEAEPQAEQHERGEEHREPVVALPAGLAAGPMVAAVEPLADAVHHPAMRGRGDRFHDDERHDDDDHEPCQ
jgi:hypothetical protein